MAAGLTAQRTVTVRAGPIPDAPTSIVCSVQRGSVAGWVNVGGVSGNGNGVTITGVSKFQTRSGEQYRLSVLVVGSPVPVSIIGG